MPSLQHKINRHGYTTKERKETPKQNKKTKTMIFVVSYASSKTCNVLLAATAATMVSRPYILQHMCCIHNTWKCIDFCCVWVVLNKRNKRQQGVVCLKENSNNNSKKQKKREKTTATAATTITSSSSSTNAKQRPSKATTSVYYASNNIVADNVVDGEYVWRHNDDKVLLTALRHVYSFECYLLSFISKMCNNANKFHLIFNGNFVFFGNKHMPKI